MCIWKSFINRKISCFVKVAIFYVLGLLFFFFFLIALLFLSLYLCFVSRPPVNPLLFSMKSELSQSDWLASHYLFAYFMCFEICNLVTFEIRKYLIASYSSSFIRQAHVSLRRQSSCYSFILITSILTT